MLFEIQDSIEIKTNPEKAWELLAYQFEDVSQWASGLASSTATTSGHIPKGALVSGRVCTGLPKAFDLFQEVNEVWTHYDEQFMTFGYKAQGLPSFIRRIENSWRVVTLSSDSIRVEIQPQIETGFLSGALMFLMLPFLKSMGKKTLEELKYFLEEGTPHPRKIKEQLTLQNALQG